jgi:hypothetical protein
MSSFRTKRSAVCRSIDFDDADMKELAKGWPQLWLFSSMTQHTMERKPRVALAGLIPLVKYC